MADRTWTLAANSLLLSGATCAVTIPLGILLAWLLARTDLPGRRAALVAFGILVFVPLYLQAAAWQAGFGLQGWHTLVSGGTVWLDGWRGAVWVHSMSALPWVVLIVGTGLRLVEPELEEQALLDASAWRVLWRVTLPGAGVAVGVAALWVLIVTAGEITVTDLFGVRTYAEELYTRFAVSTEPGDAPLAAAPGVLLTAGLVLAGLLLCARLAPRQRALSLRPGLVFRLRRWRWPLALLVAAILLVVVGVPLGNLCYKAGVAVSQTETGYARSWSLPKCLTFIAQSPVRYRREFAWSLRVAALAAMAAVAVGIGLACLAVRRQRSCRAARLTTGMILTRQARNTVGRPFQAVQNGLERPSYMIHFVAGLVLALTAVCLAVPGPLVGLGAIWLFNRPGWPMLNYLYDQSILAPWLVLWVRGLPLATLVLWHALRTVPEGILDSAALDGAGPLARLWRIVLPNRVPALAVAWLVAFAVALADLAASILVVPPGMTTLPIRIFDLLHAGVEDQVAGVCLAQAIVFAMLAAVIAWLVRRWQN